MPKRLPPWAHTRVYDWLVKRDGETCVICGVARDPGSNRLDIDHIDNDSSNWSRENLQLLCRPCNVAKENRHRATVRASSPSPRVCVKEKERAGARRTDWRTLLREITPADKWKYGWYDDWIVSNASSPKEMEFRRYVMADLRERQVVDPECLICSGAEVARCSTITARRYLSKMVSVSGPATKILLDGVLGIGVILKTVSLDELQSRKEYQEQLDRDIEAYTDEAVHSDIQAYAGDV